MSLSGNLLSLLSAWYFVYCCNGNVSTIVEPILVLDGDPYILVMYDFHSEMDDQGNCTNLNPRALEMLWSLRWIDSVLRSKPNNRVGLLVHDMCGSRSRALQVVSRYLNPEKCGNGTNLAGIISYTSKDVRHTITALVEPFGILHATISDDEHISKGYGTVLDLSIVSPWKIQAVTVLLGQTGWKKISTIALNSSTAKAEQRLFQRMALHQELCLTEVLVYNNVSVFDTLTSKVVVFFVSGTHDLDELVSELRIRDERMFIVVGDVNLLRISAGNLSHVVFMQEVLPSKNYILLYLLKMLGDIETEVDPISNLYLQSLPHCSRNTTTGQTACSQEAIDYLSLRMNGRDMMAVFTSFFNLERLILRAEALNCTEFNFHKCSKFVPYVALSIDQPSSGFPFNLYELTEGWLVDEPTDVVVSSTMAGNMTEIARIYRDEFIWTASSGWRKFKERLNNSACEHNVCPQCDSCAHSEPKADKAAILEGDLYIGGLFPIHTFSKNGDECGRFSWESVQLAEAVLYAVDSVKIRHQLENLLPNVTLGAIIVDSCGKSGVIEDYIPLQKKCPVESGTTRKSYSGDLNNVLSYVEYIPEPFNRKSKLLTDKTIVQFSDPGVDLEDFTFGTFLPETLSLLKAMNWSYISVVLSKEVNADTAVKNALQTFQQNGVCIAQKVVFDSMDLLNLTSNIFGTSRKTDAVLLLTLPAHSVQLLENVTGIHGINILLQPWSIPNEFDVQIPGMVLIIPRRTSDTDFYSYLHSIDSSSYTRNPWMKEFHESYYRCHYQANSEILYPDQCNDNASVEGQDNSTLISRLIHTLDLVIMTIDKLYKELCPTQNGLCQEFINYSHLNTRLKELIPSVKAIQGMDLYGFNDRGKLNIRYDIINVRAQGSFDRLQQVKIGSFIDGVLTVDDNAVLAYDHTGIPVVIPHQCSGRCSECNICSSAGGVIKNEHYYRPGDLVVGAVFPVHQQGSLPFTCGDLSISREIEELVDAFLFATSTAKYRYPYILPNVTIGSLVVDSCSDGVGTLKTLMNFETCTSTFVAAGTNISPYPAQVPSYILYGNSNTTVPSQSLLARLGKHSVSLGDSDVEIRDPFTREVIMMSPGETVEVIVDLLREMDWTYVSVVNSMSDLYTEAREKFFISANRYNICVSFNHSIGLNHGHSSRSAIDLILKSPANTVVLLANENDVRYLFSHLSSHRVSKNFIIGDIEQDWGTVKDFLLPLGTIVLNRDGKINSGFYNYSADPVHTFNSSLGNPWFEKFIKGRERCRNANNIDCKSSSNILMEASKIVLGVDVLLHILHERYKKECPGVDGLCTNLQNVKTDYVENQDHAYNISFSYQGNNTIKIPSDGSGHGTFILKSFQQRGFEQVGVWNAGMLNLNQDNIKSFDNNGVPYTRIRQSKCVQNCVCVNTLPDNSTLSDTDTAEQYADLLFFDSSAEFDNELWAIIVLIVSLGGASVVLMFMIYVVYKVCIGYLYKRYIGLGLTMLLAVIFLYLAVLPFLFTPSTVVCACRRFIPGLAYALVFATILAKLMALRAHKLIGLGGELSNINQFISIMFISGVQISIGVQWLVYENDHLVVRTDADIIQYACNFQKVEFVKYLAYVIFIILVCGLYSLSVRNEKKNLGEARLILAASWITVVVWIAWLAVIYVEPRDYVEPTVCTGMIVSATVIVLTVFVPKLYRITNLKYDIRDSGMENGGLGKIDAEFIFERPFTLPATNLSEATAFKYADKTNPKSVSTYDTNTTY